MDFSPPGSSVLWFSQAWILEWGCHFLLQGIYPTQRSPQDLLHCRQILSTAEPLGSWTWQGPVFGSTGRAADSAWEPVFCRSRTWRSSCSWWRSGLCVSLSFTHHFLSFNVSFYLSKKRELNWIIYSSSCLKALFYMCCKPALSNGAQSFGPMHLVQSNRPLERKWDQPFNYGTGVCLVNSSGPSAPGV